MSVAELKRCFECGATYPQEVLACENDGTPLCFDTVGRRWKIEGVIGRRAGGAIFAAFQLVSGQYAAIDMLPGSNAREATASTRFNQQLQALRILDQNKSILRLIEEGTERDGSRFMVTELGELRPLQDLIDEWRRPDKVLMEPAEAALLVRPLLSLLSTAARLGMAHGSLDATQIFVGSANDFANGLSNVATVKLHGLAAIGMGPQLREAQAADLRGIGRVLYELCTGKLPPAGNLLAAEGMPMGLEGPLGQVVLRAVGAPGHEPYTTAEELQRGLSTAALGGRPSQTSNPTSFDSMRSDPGGPKIPSMPSAPSMPSMPSMPPVPSGPVASKPGSQNSLPPNSLPPVRVTAQHSVIPAPLGSMISGPQRSGLTSELRQVSILDLMREMNEQKEKQEPPAREETLARSRFRPSLNNIKPMPRPAVMGGGEPDGPVRIRPGSPDAPLVGAMMPDSGATAMEPTVVDPNNPQTSAPATRSAPVPVVKVGTAPNQVISRSMPVVKAGTAPNQVIAPPVVKAGTAPNQVIAPPVVKAGTAPNQVVSPLMPVVKPGTAPNRTVSQSVPVVKPGTAPNRTISQSGSFPPAGVAADSNAVPANAAAEAPASTLGVADEPAPPPPSAQSRPRNSAAQTAVTTTSPTINPDSPPRGIGTVDSPSAPASSAAESSAEPPATVAPPPTTELGPAKPPLAAPPAAQVAREIPSWTWLAVIGTLLAIIAVLVIKLLTRK